MKNLLAVQIIRPKKDCHINQPFFKTNKHKNCAKKFVFHKKAVYLHRFRANVLGYGVMVTLQILVLPFLVRVRVAQQISKASKRAPF